MNIFDLARACGIAKTTFYNRLNHGWTLEKALYTPPQRTNKIVDKPGCEYTKTYTREQKELNMDAVDNFLNPGVGEGHDFDFEDAQKGTNRLKRVFTRMYEGKKLNEKY